MRGGSDFRLVMPRFGALTLELKLAGWQVKLYTFSIQMGVSENRGP